MDNCLVDCADSGSYRDTTTGACYFLVVDDSDGGIDWNEAKAGCEKLSARLATLADVALRDRVLKGLQAGEGVWVGASQQEKTSVGCNGAADSWTWLTGETVPNDTTTWTTNQPNDANSNKCEDNEQNCARTESGSDFRLNDAPCKDEDHPGVCVRIPKE